jgi:hypothetical protein
MKKLLPIALAAVLVITGCGGIGEDPPGGGRTGFDAQGNYVVYTDGNFCDLDHSIDGGTQYWDGCLINLASGAAGGHSGAVAMEFEPVQAGGLGVFSTGIDLSQFQSLTLWVKAPTDNITFGFGVGAGADEVKVDAQLVAAGDEWVKLTMPINKNATIKTAFWVYFGQQSGKLYIDDIIFMKK